MTKPNIMTHSQRQYAVQRVEKVAKELELKARELYPAPKLTAKELVRLVKAGKLRLKYDLNDEVCRYTDVSSVWDISHLTEENNPKFMAADAKIDKHLQAVKDSIMLGDNDEALKAIAAFEAFKV